MKSLKGILGLMSASVLVLAALQAGGATLPPFLSDEMSVISTVNGRTTGRLLQSFEPENAGELVDTDSGAAVAAMYGSPTILLEPDGTISDIFGVASRVPGTFSVGYISDPLVNPQSLAYFGVAVVGGNYVSLVGGNVTILAEIPGFQYGADQYVTGSFGGRSWFASDVDVPDGGLTVALLGFALVGIEGIRRQFKK